MSNTWAVFISGRGSNLNALTKKNSLKIALVVTSREDAGGVAVAKANDIPVFVFDGDFEKLNGALSKHQASHIFLAGFMKILPASFLQNWLGKILNVHPSLLPTYKGAKAMQRAYDDGAPMGVTIHHVVPEVDAGEALLQELVIESPSKLSFDLVKELMHKKEHELVCKAVDLI